jgi:hypothetical protein
MAAPSGWKAPSDTAQPSSSCCPRSSKLRGANSPCHNLSSFLPQAGGQALSAVEGERRSRESNDLDRRSPLYMLIACDSVFLPLLWVSLIRVHPRQSSVSFCSSDHPIPRSPDHPILTPSPSLGIPPHPRSSQNGVGFRAITGCHHPSADPRSAPISNRTLLYSVSTLVWLYAEG